MINIIMLTHWLGGDIMPFITLGEQFKKKGHRVTLLTHCVYKQNVENAGLKFEPVDNLRDYKAMFQQFEDFADPVNNKEGTLKFISSFQNSNHMVNEVALIKKYIIEGEKNIIICRHRSSMAGLLASEKFKIPVLSVFLAPNYVAHLELHEQLIGDFMKDEINKARRTLDMDEIDSWTNWMCSPKGIIGQWPKGYASEVKNILPTMKEVGFIVKENKKDEQLPAEVLEFLKKNKNPIIISGGTSRYVCKELYQVALEGCIKTNTPTIVVSPNKDFLPKIKKDNILCVGFVNLQLLMNYASTIIHHGGINTSGEACFAGIPQLVLAHYADRPDNGQRLEKEGIAKWLPRKMWTAENVAHCLEDISQSDVEMNCKNYAKSIGDTACCDKYMKVIETAINDSDYVMGNTKIQVVNYENMMQYNQKEQLDQRKKLLLKLALERKLNK